MKKGLDTRFTGEVVAKASLRDVRISPRKARLAVDMIKGRQVEFALRSLEFSPKKSAELTRKLLNSAIANAREQKRADVDSLWVTAGWVDMGKVSTQFMPRAQGRASPIKKRTSHITLILGKK